MVIFQQVKKKAVSFKYPPINIIFHLKSVNANPWVVRLGFLDLLSNNDINNNDLCKAEVELMRGLFFFFLGFLLGLSTLTVCISKELITSWFKVDMFSSGSLDTFQTHQFCSLETLSLRPTVNLDRISCVSVCCLTYESKLASSDWLCLAMQQSQAPPCHG